MGFCLLFFLFFKPLNHNIFSTSYLVNTNDRKVKFLTIQAPFRILLSKIPVYLEMTNLEQLPF